MDLNARVDVNFARVDVNFQMFTVPLILSQFFSVLIPINIKVKTKFQPNVPSQFEEMDLNARVNVTFLGST